MSIEKDRHGDLFNDNKKLEGVTYDTIAAASILGCRVGQLATLIDKGVLKPCNAPIPGSSKFYRRFTATALESARPYVATVLKPTPLPKPKDEGTNARLARVEEQLDRVLAIVGRLDQALNGPSKHN